MMSFLVGEKNVCEGLLNAFGNFGYLTGKVWRLCCVYIKLLLISVMCFHLARNLLETCALTLFVFRCGIGWSFG